MEQRTLGHTGLRVPVIGMGTWRTFDVYRDAAKQNAHATVDIALRVSASFFDSSPMYGAAEQVLAETLQGRREQAIVATKVWASTRREGQVQVKRALSFFGSVIDLYQIHNLVDWREHLVMLEQLRDAGKVRAIGATHYSSTAFAELSVVMQTGRITAIQIPYNPLEREVEQAILPLAADLNTGVVVMRPFAEGELMRIRPFGVTTWAQVLLKWILSDSRCHVTIPATSRPSRMEENAAAGNPPWFGPKERELVILLA